MPTVTHIIDKNLPIYATGTQFISGNKIFGINNISLTALMDSPILGGFNNKITGVSIGDSFIANGDGNMITGAAGDSFILHGISNKIGGGNRPSSNADCRSYISNGFQNSISGGSCYANINNGVRNIVDRSSRATIGNGNCNCITGGSGSCFVDILNGASNTIEASCYSSVLQGTANYLGRSSTGTSDILPKASLSTIVNGSNNRIFGDFNLIGGGSFNHITGGLINDGSCQSSARSNVIVGGANNSIKNSSCSAILGGRYNEVIHNGATIIGDGSLNIKTSRDEYSLLLSFQNGIYLESPIFDFTGGRPTVNGTGVFLNGELPNSIVYNTGDQTITGVKTFSEILTRIIGVGAGNPQLVAQIDDALVEIRGIEKSQLAICANGPYGGEKKIAFYDDDIIMFQIVHDSSNSDGNIYFSGNPSSEIKANFNKGIVAPNLVYNTGNQTISGAKTFATGIVAPNLVYNTGNQTISGEKTFATGISARTIGVGPGGLGPVTNIDGGIVSIEGIDKSELSIRANSPYGAEKKITFFDDGMELVFQILHDSNSDGGNIHFSGNPSSEIKANFNKGIVAPNLVYNTGNQTISGVKTFASRPIVNGTGVLLSGSTPFVLTYGHTRDNTTAGDVRRYFGPHMDIGPVSLNSNENRRTRIMKDCFLREVSWAVIARDNIPTPSNAMTGYFKNFGNNPSADDQTSGVQVTSAINMPTTNEIHNYSTGNLNIPITGGDYVSFYYQTNFTAGSSNAASGLAVNVDAYFYV